MLLAEEDWNSINETLYILSIPGMRESIVDGMKPILKNVIRNLTGSVETIFHPASKKGRKNWLLLV